MKFTFICEDEEEKYKVTYTCNELIWWKTLPHYESFLRGAGFVVEYESIQAEGY